MRNAALVIGATGRVSNASPHYRTNAISVFFANLCAAEMNVGL